MSILGVGSPGGGVWYLGGRVSRGKGTPGPMSFLGVGIHRLGYLGGRGAGRVQGGGSFNYCGRLDIKFKTSTFMDLTCTLWISIWSCL